MRHVAARSDAAATSRLLQIDQPSGTACCTRVSGSRDGTNDAQADEASAFQQLEGSVGSVEHSLV
jgi:hypothetical protein